MSLSLSLSPQFSQLVIGDVALLGGGSYMLCTDGQQLLRQVLHPEASRKVCHSGHHRGRGSPQVIHC